MSFSPGSQALVTGARGFIGESLVSRLARAGYRVRRVGRPGAAPPTDAGPHGQDIVFADLTRRAAWEELLAGVDVVFHLAAQTSTRKAEASPLDDLESNVVPMVQLLDASRRIGYRGGVVFAGTVTEMGVAKHLPVDGTEPSEPLTVYDLHKLTAEWHLRLHAAQGGVRGVTLRLPNVYGPGPPSSSADRGVLNQMIRKALRGETLQIYGDGLFQRDYVFVDDVVEAFIAAARHMEDVSGEVFIIGTGKSCTVADAVRLVAERVKFRTGRAVLVRHIEAPAPLSALDRRDFVADVRRFAGRTQWRAEVELPEGIDRTIAAMLERSGHEGARTA